MSAQPVSEILIDPAAQVFKDITETEFQQGVFIDFAPYPQSFFNEEIIAKFKGSLEAVTAQNVEDFKPFMQEDGYPREALFFSEPDVQYMFYNLDLLEKIKIDGRDQIRVGVRYAKKFPDGTVQNQGITYFFTQNKAGVWGIANID